MRPNKLPSVSTVNNMNVQRLILAQTQVAEELSQRKSTCLLSDETDKYGNKIQRLSCVVQRRETMGVRIKEHPKKKDADATIKTFQEILSFFLIN